MWHHVMRDTSRPCMQGWCACWASKQQPMLVLAWSESMQTAPVLSMRQPLSSESLGTEPPHRLPARAQRCQGLVPCYARLCAKHSDSSPDALGSRLLPR